MILHVDMDAFYAAVEERDNPELQGRPLIVGGAADRRGVVSTCNYEARQYGVHSAMPMSTAVRKCPQAVVLPTRMSHYAGISKQIREILLRFTPIIEPLSLDEAFLDVEGCEGLFGSPVEIAKQIRRDILQETRLVASVGVAPNKFLAKVASDLDKPDGLVVVHPDRITEFLDPLSISRLWGVGAVSAKALRSLGIETVGRLREFALETLTDRFGEIGNRLWHLARGIDHRSVVPDREAKSISHETTFATDVSDQDVLKAWLIELTDQVARRLRAGHLRGKTVNLKLRFANFETITRARSFAAAVNSTRELCDAAVELLSRCPVNRPVRLIGVGVSNLRAAAGQQQSLLDEDRRDQQLDATVDSIRTKFGSSALKRGTNPGLGQPSDS